jgi:dynein heavy chain
MLEVHVWVPTYGFLLQECKEVYAFFSHQLLDSLQKATRLSLDTMKKRIFVTRQVENY